MTRCSTASGAPHPVRGVAGAHDHVDARKPETFPMRPFGGHRGGPLPSGGREIAAAVDVSWPP